MLISQEVSSATLRRIRRLIKVVHAPEFDAYLRDDSRLMLNPDVWRETIEAAATLLGPIKPDVILAIMTRGTAFGTALAFSLNAGLALAHKKNGKVPVPVLSQSYKLEYGTDTMKIVSGLLKPGQKVVIADNALSTGGTIEAAAALVRKTGAEVTAAITISELPRFGGRKKLKALSIPTYSLLKYRR